MQGPGEPQQKGVCGLWAKMRRNPELLMLPAAFLGICLGVLVRAATAPSHTVTAMDG